MEGEVFLHRTCDNSMLFLLKVEQNKILYLLHGGLIMIDVHDMMVGNWYHDDKYDAITTLTPNLAYQTILNTCSGIPVTVDMLKRIGFEEYEDLPLEGKFYRYWDKDCKYKLDVRNFWTNSRREWYIHIDNDVCNTIGSGEFDYVHELQNLVRVITGHSLPITKEMLE